MTNAGKWIGGIIGWAASGPIGALIGVVLGAIVDRAINSASLPAKESDAKTGGRGPQPQRNSFLISLLVLSSAVIRADGKTREEELRTVRDFVRQSFGEAYVDQAMQILSSLSAQEVNVYQVGAQVAANMNYSQRLQLFHYLVKIAVSDGEFNKSERDVLEVIAGTLGLSASDRDSVFAMYHRDIDSAYAVLEISSSATDEEVKSAYRRMAMKNHPDKVASLGPDVRKAAEEKFLKIRDAYETIKKERGIQ